MTTLYVMCGCPGSGKTTYANKHIIKNKNTIYISRDEIRFKLVPEDTEYFSKETEVFNTFIDKISKNLLIGNNVIADATHLNEKSRTKLFNALWENVDLSKIKVVGIVMRTPLKECIRRNNLRKGTRSYVPLNALRRMYYSFREPTYKEYNKIFDEIIAIE